jgi:hypothetical protein
MFYIDMRMLVRDITSKFDLTLAVTKTKGAHFVRIWLKRT